MIKTENLYVAKISYLKDKKRFNKTYKTLFVIPLASENPDNLNLDGYYRLATKKGFVADENKVLNGANCYAYNIINFKKAFPKANQKRLSKFKLKRLEKELNKEQL